LGSLAQVAILAAMVKGFFRSIAGGFLMGSADLVPGVSGGTIALVLGIYERLVRTIREGSSALGALARADWDRGKRHLAEVDWGFLLSLLAGIGLAVVVLSTFIETQLEERPVIMSAAFFGLVVGSVVVGWRLVRERSTRSIVVAVGVAVVFFLLLGLRSGSNVADPGMAVLFGSGALAICAMILPGISGSLILVLVGMYESVLGAVNDRDLVSLGVFLLGAVVGLAFFSRVLHWALQTHHDLVVAGLVGLMAGSLRILWPWPGGVDSARLDAPSGDVLAAGLAGVAGLVAVYAISRLGESRDLEGADAL